MDRLVTRQSWVLDALSGLGAVICAYCGAALIVGVISMGVNLGEQSGSGGVGAVSAGLSEALLIALVACVLANRLLAGSARRSGGLVLKLHRAHSIALVGGCVLLALLVLSLVLSLVPLVSLITAFLLIGILSAVQFSLMAAMLIAFIWRRRLAPNTV